MKISIIIPTFNRLNKALKQAEFFYKEQLMQKEINQYILSDNASDPNIAILLRDATNHNGFNYRRNDKNIGAVGNIIASLNISDGDYVWFVGDDDVLTEGILKSVVDKLIIDQPDLLFINHYATNETSGKIVMESALPPLWRDKTSGTMLDIFKYSGTTMMFITACVYKTSLLKNAIKLDNNDHMRLTAPLYWSFFCAQDNNVSYITKKYINNVWGDTSWKESAKILFSISVPRELQKCLYMRYKIDQTFPLYIKMKTKELVNRLKFSIKR